MNPFLATMRGVSLQRENENISTIFSRYVATDSSDALHNTYS